MNPFDAPSDFQDFTLHDSYLEPPDLTRRLPIRDDYLLNKETLPQYSIPRPYQSHEGIINSDLFSDMFKCFFSDITVKRYIGSGVAFVSLITENLLSHPFLVLRRQCQVIMNVSS